jgi:hypothetical protein
LRYIAAAATSGPAPLNDTAVPNAAPYLFDEPPSGAPRPARLRDPGSRRIYAGRLRLRTNTTHAFQDLANGTLAMMWVGRAGTWPWLGRWGFAAERRPGMNVYAGARLEPGTPLACWRVL